MEKLLVKLKRKQKSSKLTSKKNRVQTKRRKLLTKSKKGKLSDPKKKTQEKVPNQRRRDSQPYENSEVIAQRMRKHLDTRRNMEKKRD